jgi:hypothetical protein
MNYLITLICIFIALAIFAGAFYLAKFVIAIKMRNDLLEENYKLAAEHIEKQEEQIMQLTQEVTYMRHEAEISGERIPAARSWNPSDPLNSRERQ